jgi:hypothetical protein
VAIGFSENRTRRAAAAAAPPSLSPRRFAESADSAESATATSALDRMGGAPSLEGNAYVAAAPSAALAAHSTGEEGSTDGAIETNDPNDPNDPNGVCPETPSRVGGNRHVRTGMNVTVFFMRRPFETFARREVVKGPEVFSNVVR